MTTADAIREACAELRERTFALGKRADDNVPAIVQARTLIAIHDASNLIALAVAALEAAKESKDEDRAH